ncbi:IclR family transcriptional regulator [Yimella sp. cx-573]|nr:IclR family transcriptional regulator [Yimella sp. cx-573]
MTESSSTAGRGAGVQSLGRAFALLEHMAAGGGTTTVPRLAESTGLPLGTTHRMMRTLVDLGYARQEASKEHTLGPKLIRLGDVASRSVARWARPAMARVVARTGESVNIAALDSDQIVYLGQVMASRNSMRMFTEVGRRVLPHSTAVGKAIMATMPPAEVEGLLERTGMPQLTEFTIGTSQAFATELGIARERGYAVDEQEQELGVRCVAVKVPTETQRLAVSVSGPVTRMTDDAIAAAVGPLQDAAKRIAAELG